MTRNEKRILLGFNAVADAGNIRPGMAAIAILPEQFLEIIHHPQAARLPKLGVVKAVNVTEVLLAEEDKTSQNPLQTIYPLRRLQVIGGVRVCENLMHIHGAVDDEGNIMPDNILKLILSDIAHAPLCNALYAYLLCQAFYLTREQDDAIEYVADCLVSLL